MAAADRDCRPDTAPADPAEARAKDLCRAAVDLSGDAYSVLRAVRQGSSIVDWQFVLANDLVQRSLSPDVAIEGRCWSELHNHGDGAEVRELFTEALLTATRCEREIELRYRSGAVRWQLIIAIPMDADMLVIVSRDVTDRHCASRALDEERERFRMLIEHSPGALVVIDEQGGMQYRSPRADRMFRDSDDTSIDGELLFSRVLDPDRRRLREWFIDIVAAGPSVEAPPISAQIQAPDGSVRVYEYTALNRLDDPLIKGVIVHFHDITAHARAEARARSLAENASDIVLLTDGVTVRWISHAVERLLGHRVADLVGTDPLELVHPDDREDMITRTAESIMNPTGDTNESMVVRVLAADGSIRWFAATARNRLDDPLLAGMLVYLQDVSEQQRSAEALRDSEARTRSLLDTAPDAIITADAMGRIVEFNRAAETTFGWSGAEILGRSYTEILPPEDADLLRALTNHGEEPVHMFQSRGRHRSGAIFPLQGSVAAVEVGGERFFTTIVRDITEQKAIETRLKVLALNDPLTGLPNRQRVLEVTGEALRRAQHEVMAVAALFIDLDRFKLVNDTLGHQVGDDLLRQAATRITAVTRDTDIVGRLGGDEFVVICTDVTTGITGPVRLAQRLTDAFSIPFELAGRSLFVTSSIGIGYAGDATTSPTDLLRQADTAMYRAKENGRGRFELFDHTMQSWVAQRLDLETSLRLAIDGHEIVPFYQPIVELTSGQITKIEALARWIRPGKGIVPPGEFIEIAEDAGLITAIGNVMLEQAASDCYGWQSLMPGVGVTVNVSARQFATSDLTTVVDGALANAGLAPELLTIEITESALLLEPDNVINQLRVLRESGVRVALDDFGTGYSSLTYLRTLPLDTLKIDKTFVDALASNGQDSSIVEAILTLARVRELEVIAEGIEDDTVARRLSDLGCVYGQGYLYARPAPLEELRSRADQHRAA